MIHERVLGEHAEALVAAHGERRVLAFPAAEPAFLAELAETYRPEAVLSAMRQENKPVRVWFRNSRGAHESISVAPEAAARLFDAGMTLYYDPPDARLRKLAGDLAELVGEDPDHAKPSMFLSKKGGVTPPHFDSGDGFTLQLLGQKRWSTSERAEIEYPPHNFAPGMKWHDDLAVIDGAGPPRVDELGPRSDHLLVPGRCIYVPGGAWHSVECVEDSVSIDLNMTAGDSRWCDVLGEVVRAVLLRDGEARRYWGGTLGRESAAAGIAEGDRVLERLRAQLGRLRMRDVIGEERGSMGPGPWVWNPAAVVRTRREPDGRCSIDVEIRGFYEQTGTFSLPAGSDVAMASLLRRPTLTADSVRDALAACAGADAAQILGALFTLQAIQVA